MNIAKSFMLMLNVCINKWKQLKFIHINETLDEQIKVTLGSLIIELPAALMSDSVRTRHSSSDQNKRLQLASLTSCRPVRHFQRHIVDPDFLSVSVNNQTVVSDSRVENKHTPSRH